MSRTTVPSTTQPPAADLSVSVPLNTPSCDGGYIVILGAAVVENDYQRTVHAFLDEHPGTRYLHAPSTGCRSLRHRVDGVDIHSVYYGPFPGRGNGLRQVCGRGRRLLRPSPRQHLDTRQRARLRLSGARD